MLGADGAFFSVTRDLELRHGHTEGLQLSFNGFRTSFSEEQIVRIGAPLITMPFDDNCLVRLGLEHRGGSIERRSCITADHILIEIEVDVGECRQRVTSGQYGIRRRSHCSRWFWESYLRMFHALWGRDLCFDRPLDRYRGTS